MLPEKAFYDPRRHMSAASVSTSDVDRRSVKRLRVAVVALDLAASPVTQNEFLGLMSRAREHENTTGITQFWLDFFIPLNTGLTERSERTAQG